VRAIVRNTNEVSPVAAPMKFNRLPEPVFISVPLKLGNSIDCSIYNSLSSQEKEGLTTSEWLRNLILKELKERDALPTTFKFKLEE
jgi:malate/lactate dehydrogenase